MSRKSLCCHPVVGVRIRVNNVLASALAQYLSFQRCASSELHCLLTTLLVISPEQIPKPNSCALYYFLMVCNMLIIFGRGIDKDQKRCCLQESQLLLSPVLISPVVVPGLPFGYPLFQSDMLPVFFSGLLSYLVGMKRRISRCLACKRDNSHFLHYVLISTEAEILCRP